MHCNIGYRKSVVTKRYLAVLSKAEGNSSRLKRIQDDYNLVMQVLNAYKKTKKAEEAARANNLKTNTAKDWIYGRTLPRSLRLNATGANTLNKKKLRNSVNFLYVLGAYQPRVKYTDDKRISINTKDQRLEEKVFEAMLKSFNDMKSQHALYESKEIMRYIKKITDNNNSLPEILLRETKHKSRKQRESAYITGLLDSRVSISCYRHKIKNSTISRKKPIAFLHVTNDCLIEKIKGLLEKHKIKSTYITDKRDNTKYLSINELKSIKKIRTYITHPLKKTKLNYLIRYAEDIKKHDYNGKTARKIKQLKKEKQKEKNTDEFMLRSSPLPRRVAEAF